MAKSNIPQPSDAFKRQCKLIEREWGVLERELASLPGEPTLDDCITSLNALVGRLEAGRPESDGCVQVFDGDGTDSICYRATSVEDAEFFAAAVSRPHGNVTFKVYDFAFVAGSGSLGPGQGQHTERIKYHGTKPTAAVAEDVRRLRLLLGHTIGLNFQCSGSGLGVRGRLLSVIHDNPRSFLFTIDQDDR